MGDNYKRIKKLGEGSFGKCYLAECTTTGARYVIKEIDIRQMSTAEKDEALKEAKILERLQHPNIIRFHEVYRTKNGKLCIVMDFADGGDLQDKIKNQRGRLFSEREVLDFFVQMCLALKHCHDRKILHRDIKSQNVFLSGSSRVKLGDFGIARVLSNTCEKARTMVGTPYYLSPEIIENKPYSFKSDVWSLGVMLYELCTLKPPFDASSLHFLAMKIVRGNYNPVPPHYSRDLKSLVTQMLTVDPNRRPTINQVLRLPIIKERIKQFLSETVHSQEFSHTVLHSQNVFTPPEVLRREIPPSRDAPRPRAAPAKEPPKDLPRELPREFQLIEAQREKDRLLLAQKEKERMDVQRDLDRIEAQRARDRIEAQRERDVQKERERQEAQRERERVEAQREKERQEAYKERERDAQRERDRLEAIKNQERVEAVREKLEKQKAERKKAEARQLQDARQLEARREEPKGVLFIPMDKPKKKDKSLKEKNEAERRRKDQEEEERIRKAQENQALRNEKVQQREEERQRMMMDIKSKKKQSIKKKKPVEESPVEEDKAEYVKELYQVPREPRETKEEFTEPTRGGSKELRDHKVEPKNILMASEVQESERKRMLDDIRRRKKELSRRKKEIQVEVYYPGMKQETEDEAFALALQEVLLVEDGDEEQQDEEPAVVVEIGEDREDYDPDFEEEDKSKNTHDRLETLRLYLEEKLGADNLMTFYELIKESGTEIQALNDFPYDKFVERLEGILTLEQIKEYSSLIMTLIFLENESYSAI